jgi:putative SOS response-associated peptidase YedK
MLESCAFAAVQRMAVPNQFVAEVHDRMPILLAEQDFEP